ncbi:MAG: protein translocase subunit SecDF, partial [Bacteroidota bacterium]
MRNKNTVVFLLIVFSLICAYNLYWTYVQFSLDKERAQLTDAMEALKDDKSKWSAGDSATYNAWSAFMSDEDKQAKYKSAIDQSFTLGLDLQGGMFVTLEVGVDGLVKQMASNPRDSSLNAAIACASLRQQEEARNFVPLFVECFKQINPNGSLGVMFSNEELEISVSTPDDEVQAKLETEAKAAIDRTFNILRTRIDQFGVVSPNLQKQESTGRILLELPGVKEPERVRKLLQGTAELEFYVTRTWADAYPVLLDGNTSNLFQLGI